MANSDRKSRQRGAALITTLLASTFLLLIASLASEQAVVSFLIEHRARESLEAMIAAETGLSAALADFAAEPKFDRFELAAGAPFPFAASTPTGPLPDSFVVTNEIRPRSPRFVDFVARASGRNHASRTLAATIERSDEPYIPAAIYLAGASPSIALSGRMRISGSSVAGNPVPAIAGAAPAPIESIHQQFVSAGATLTGEPVAALAAWSDLAEVIERVRADAGDLPDAVVGIVPAAILSSRGSIDVTTAEGSGIWLIDGDLSVQADLSFEGLLLVLGDINIDEGAVFRITGALVQAPPGSSVRNRGDTTIAYGAAALRQVDAMTPGLLGRRARLIGWRDDS